MNAADARLIKKTGDKAYEYEKAYHGCSQCTLAALQECLKLGDKESYKAATSLAGGIARMGETCGALMGGLMAIGLTYGREKLEDNSLCPGYGKAMELSMELCRQFREAMGSTRCWDIHRSLFGRVYDLSNPKEREEFRKSPDHEKCPEVARKAAELAAETILKGGYRPGAVV